MRGDVTLAPFLVGHRLVQDGVNDIGLLPALVEHLQVLAQGLFYPARRKMSETCTGVHAPPRAVAMPRAVNARATARSDLTPLA